MSEYALRRDELRQIYKAAAYWLEIKTSGACPGACMAIAMTAERFTFEGVPANRIATEAVFAFAKRCGRPPYGGFWAGSIWSQRAHDRRVRLLHALGDGRSQDADDILDQIDEENPP